MQLRHDKQKAKFSNFAQGTAFSSLCDREKLVQAALSDHIDKQCSVLTGNEKVGVTSRWSIENL